LAHGVPKPLVRIAGETRFLDYLMFDIARHGVSEILLLAGHLAEVVAERYDGRAVLGAAVRVVVEREPAGTGGALRHVADQLDDVFLMSNGDSFCELNYLALEQALGPDDIGAMALRQVDDAARFGSVELAGDRVTAFREKNAASGPGLISAGVYVLRRRVLDLITHLPCSIESAVFPQLAESGALAGQVSNGYFIDIGLPETLAAARADFAERTRRPAILVDRDGTLIKDEGYTFRPETLEWQPGAIEAVRAVNDAGALAIVVSNQSGVARGYYGEEDVRRFHAHMQAELTKHGAHIDAFYFCPHHGEGVAPEFTHADHPDRKPNPGMLRRALIEWPIDAQRCAVIGDTALDTAAAAALDLPSWRVAPGELLGATQQALAAPARTTVQPTANAALKQRAAAARAWLFEHALPLWWRVGYDRSADCFHERIGPDGAALADLPRRIRVQARQTVVYARAGRLGWDGPWREAVETGAQILLTHALRDDGGTRHMLGPNGRSTDERRDLYDLAFVVFALAEAAHVLGNRPDLIAAAEKLVAWAEANWAHDAGGFSEGDVTPTPPRRQNPHMHMFEALLALHEATGKRGHLDRASRIADLFRTKLFDTRHGALPEYFDDGWRAESDIVEPGHHFEWSWLLHRWHGAGGGDLAHIAERLRVHAEVYGVAPSGAVYDELHADGRARTKTSRLWPHTERIKANLARFERTRDPNAAHAAAQAFDMLMRYCDTPIKGLWRDRLDASDAFIDEPAPASSFYHVMFAIWELVRVADGLE